MLLLLLLRSVRVCGIAVGSRRRGVAVGSRWSRVAGDGPVGIRHGWSWAVVGRKACF
ncbi:hypothetical protein Hanom_Chr15g01403081 [Helianthus anomalus]